MFNEIRAEIRGQTTILIVLCRFMPGRRSRYQPTQKNGRPPEVARFCLSRHLRPQPSPNHVHQIAAVAQRESSRRRLLVKGSSIDARWRSEAIFRAANSIDLPLIAEMVETKGELEVIRELGLFGVMGRLIGPPEPM